MSYRKEKFMSLAGGASLSMTTNELKEMARKLLDAGIHGICFSAYDEGQAPGDQLTDAQIRRKLEILKPHVKWVRTFSCTEGNELIARIAHSPFLLAPRIPNLQQTQHFRFYRGLLAVQNLR